jgi:tRNA A-37 threonylcarbamoyl transferase component Bud32
MGLLSNPLFWLAPAGGVALVLMLLLKRRRPRPATAPSFDKTDSEVRRLLEAGDYEAAARKAYIAGKIEPAIEYYLRAERIDRAAQLAERAGDLGRAAELYERAEDLALAIKLYEQAGLTEKADQLAEHLRRAADLERKRRNTGRVSSRYTVAKELGRGTMAIVHHARDNTLEREVVLKFLPQKLQEQPVVVEGFLREGKAAARLNHPNIVTVYDVGTLEGRAFICMELVSGTTVQRLVQDTGRLKVLDALRIPEQVLSALDYAHDREMLHLDIKPSNIMRNELGVVKLMEFGLAKILEGQTSKAESDKDTSYLAPEQLAGKHVDASSDIFAFGASLYEMLAGRRPFEGTRREAPEPLSDVNPTVPRGCDRR